jgi:hypothetical protein
LRPSSAAPGDDLLLNIGDDLPGIGLVPAPIEILGGKPELDHQIAGQVFRLYLTALLPPQPNQRRLITPHDDPGIRTANKPRRSAPDLFHMIFFISLLPGLNGMSVYL